MDPNQLQQLMMMLPLLLQQRDSYQNPLQRMFGGSSPMFGNVPTTFSPLVDLSAFGIAPNTPIGMAAGSFIQQNLQQMLGPNFQAQQFTPTRNLFDFQYSANYYQQRMAAMSAAQRQEAQTYFNIMRGASRLAGVEYTEAQRRSTERFAGDIAGFAPTLSMIAPDLMDQIAGIRGSPIGFTAGMFDASRLQLDPRTGALGMTGERAAALSQEVWNRLYGPGANLGEMRGLGGLRVGQMAQQLMARGYGPAIATADEERGALAGVDQNNPQAVENAMRSFNATRTADLFKKYAGAVSAMRDIFGDMGHQGSMLEIFNGLDSLTQGGMAHMTPQQIERSVRTTYAIARYTGMGIERIQNLQNTVAQTLDAHGMGRESAAAIAQASALFGIAYGQTGRPTGVGTYDTAMALQRDAQLRAQAGFSPMAARIGAFMEIGETRRRAGVNVAAAVAGAPALNYGFAPGTEAAALFEAIRSGRPTYTFNGEERTALPLEGDMQRIMTDAGVPPDLAAAAVVRDPRASASQITRYNVPNFVREYGQGRTDVEPAFTRLYAAGVAPALAASAVPEGARPALASEIGAMLARETRSLLATQPELFTDMPGDTQARNRIITARVRQQFGGRLQGMSDADIENMVTNAYRVGNAGVRMPGVNLARGNESQFQVMQDHSPLVMERQRRAAEGMRTITAAQEAFSRLGLPEPVTRFVEMLQNVPQGGGPFFGILQNMFGINRRDLPAGAPLPGQAGSTGLTPNSLTVTTPVVNIHTGDARLPASNVPLTPAAAAASALGGAGSSSAGVPQPITGRVTLVGLTEAILSFGLSGLFPRRTPNSPPRG